MVVPGVETQVKYTEVPGVVARKFPTGCVTRAVRIYAGIGSGVRYGVHCNSLNNMMRGVAERVLYKPTATGLARPAGPIGPNVFKTRLRSVRGLLLRHLTPTPIVSIEDYPLLYTGRKRVVYEKAVVNLLSRGFSRDDACIRAFVKAEKINFTAKGDPAPRMIQPRAPEFNVMVGRYLKKFEKQLFLAFRRAFGYNVILKGLNAEGVARALRRNWDAFDCPVAIGLDASRFDQHVSPQALRFEHSVYNAVFNSPELAALLEMQVYNNVRGLAADGTVKYKVKGCRMSGDINTGMGNCLIMSLIVLAYFEFYGLRARLANNGDDCVVICESRDLWRMADIGRWFRDFGFVLTQERPVYVFEQIEFCQTQPVRLSNGWRMVRNPWTAASKDAVSLLSWENPTDFDAWAASIGACGLSLTRGVPFWESYYTNLLGKRSEKAWAAEKIRDSGMGYMSQGVGTAVIDDEARFSFYLAFGMLPDEQEALENEHYQVAYQTPRPMTFAEVDLITSPLQLCATSRLKAS